MRALLESFAKKRYSAVDIEFIDLGAQQRRLKPQIDAAIATVLSHGRYVMGPEVKEFEADPQTIHELDQLLMNITCGLFLIAHRALARHWVDNSLHIGQM